MDFSPGWIMASMLVGTVGFGLFLYGKKSTRAPQLIAGVALMIESYLVSSPAWMIAGAFVLVGALWAAVRAGY